MKKQEKIKLISAIQKYLISIEYEAEDWFILNLINIDKYSEDDQKYIQDTCGLYPEQWQYIQDICKKYLI